MRRQSKVNAVANESAALFTAAVVLSLVGVLTAIEATGWVSTSVLFVLAAVAAAGGFILRSAQKS